MKYIAVFILFFTLVWQSYAGLFEYSMWEKTRINSTSYESADVVESIKIPTSSFSYSSSSYTNYGYSNNQYSNYVKPTVFADDYYSYNNSSQYYNSDDIFAEMQYYVSLANGLRTDISKMRNYGSEYTALRNQLKRDLTDLDNQIKYLSDLRVALAKNNNYNSHTNQYYYKDGIRSQKLVNYYRKYGYEYVDNSYYYYDTQYNYYQRKPTWLNENLRPREEWYIYIQ